MVPQPKHLPTNFAFVSHQCNHSDGYLYFGDEATQKHKPRNIVPLLSHPDNNVQGHYFVILVGITIGKTRLKMSFYIGSKPSTILDSGTIFTRLSQVVYNDLSSSFKKLMSKLPIADSFKILDTCYNLAGNSLSEIENA